MIAGSPALGTGRAVLWLAAARHCGAPPGRSPDADRAVRAALFARLESLGVAATGGAHLSHSGGHVAYLCGGPASAGVDLEWVRPRAALDLARFAFAPEEAEALARRPDAERAAAFTELWVLKEAAAKALGLELLTALARCRFTLDDARIAGDVPGGGTWSASLYAPRPALRLAVFAPRVEREPVFTGLDWRIESAAPRRAAWPRIAAGVVRAPARTAVAATRAAPGRGARSR